MSDTRRRSGREFDAGADRIASEVCGPVAVMARVLRVAGMCVDHNAVVIARIVEGSPPARPGAAVVRRS
jgi:hypothetical protein